MNHIETLLGKRAQPMLFWEVLLNQLLALMQAAASETEN